MIVSLAWLALGSFIGSTWAWLPEPFGGYSGIGEAFTYFGNPGYNDPNTIKTAKEVDGLKPGYIERSIASVKSIRDQLRDTELPSPFWEYEREVFTILDELIYELRTALRYSVVETEQDGRSRSGRRADALSSNEEYSPGQSGVRDHFKVGLDGQGVDHDQPTNPMKAFTPSRTRQPRK